jgi:hypothetical protein
LVAIVSKKHIATQKILISSSSSPVHIIKDKDKHDFMTTTNDNEASTSVANEHQRPAPRRSMFVKLASLPELALFKESRFSAPVGRYVRNVVVVENYFEGVSNNINLLLLSAEQ